MKKTILFSIMMHHDTKAFGPLQVAILPFESPEFVDMTALATEAAAINKNYTKLKNWN